MRHVFKVSYASFCRVSHSVCISSQSWSTLLHDTIHILLACMVMIAVEDKASLQGEAKLPCVVSRMYLQFIAELEHTDAR